MLSRIVRLLAVSLTVVWTVLLILVFQLEKAKEEKLGYEVALRHARSMYQQLSTFRTWNWDHGGGYVFVDGNTRPNPYMTSPDRDIETSDGRMLTLVNTPYMVRQVSEIGAGSIEETVRITSLRPLRPINAPKSWEIEALRFFEHGAPRFADLILMEGGSYFFRYMEPLMTEPICLGCHGSQGEVLGDVRGGISISFPMSTVLDMGGEYLLLRKISFLVFWFLGLLMIAALLIIFERKTVPASSQSSRE